jgi:hypothetical protein
MVIRFWLHDVKRNVVLLDSKHLSESDQMYRPRSAFSRLPVPDGPGTYPCSYSKVKVRPTVRFAQFLNRLHRCLLYDRLLELYASRVAMIGSKRALVTDVFQSWCHSDNSGVTRIHSIIPATMEELPHRQMRALVRSSSQPGRLS